MNAEEMRRRTKKFAGKVIVLVESLPDGPVVGNLSRQLTQSGTSVGANYRAACLARSRAEFTSKLQIALEEADETQYWLELLNESGYSSAALHEEVYQEAKELTAILMSSVKTARGVNT